MTKTHKIAVLPGDGIGPEITEQAIKTLRAFEGVLGCQFELHYGAIGGDGYDKHGHPYPKETSDLVKTCDAVFLGAVGDWKYDELAPELRPEQGLLAIRQELGLYANLRPVKAYKPLLAVSTLKPEIIDGIDMMVVRELTGGLYFGRPKSKAADHALDTMTYTKAEIQRIADVAFKLAGDRGNNLCSVDKANVLSTSQLWRETVEEVAKSYPNVTVSHMYVDNASMQLIRNPKQFDVLLTENTFGDILSDEASMLTGSLGMLPSVSLGEGTMAMYEPSHGSAPKYAGLNKVNPLATILSAGLMLKYSFGYHDAPRQLENAVLKILTDGFRTYDIADEHSTILGTAEMGDKVAEAVKAMASCQV